MLTAKHFSFNSHLGACPVCHGLGTFSVFDPELMVPDPQKTLTAGAVAPWQRGVGKRMRAYYQILLRGLAAHYHAPMDEPYADLPPAFQHALIHGTGSEPVETRILEREAASSRRSANLSKGCWRTSSICSTRPRAS